MTEVVYRMMTTDEAPAVCALVRQVFDDCLSHEFGGDGVREFFNFANPDAMQERMRSGGFVYVALQAGRPVGMLEFVPPDHIALMFVRVRGQGIGKALLARTISQARASNPDLAKLTVHSSLYAEPIYKKLRFHPTGAATTENGITFIPMQRDIR